MPLSQAEIEARCKLIDDAETDDFVTLVRLAGLDKIRNFRRADFSDVSFANTDLHGFDFRGARLHGCDFTGTRIIGAVFDQAELGAVLRHGRDNPRAPARMTGIADLSKAVDWKLYLEAYANKKRWKPLSRPLDPRHLPEGAIFSDAPGLAPQLVVVPGGTFLMGSPDGSGGDNGDVAEPGRMESEGPRRRITFDEPFAIGRFAVTVGEFRAFANSKRGDLREGFEGETESWQRPGFEQDDTHPVVNVSWDDAQAYCLWLNRKLKLPDGTYHLPSEAEWEYVARAGTEGPFWWEGPISAKRANYDAKYTYEGGPKGKSSKGTVPVESFEPNPWGLYQVHGNVWEWCQDVYVDTLMGLPENGAPREDKKKPSLRVLRGGCWFFNPNNLRSANRYGCYPTDRSSGIGFRLARTLLGP